MCGSSHRKAAEDVGMNVEREAPKAKAALWRIPGAIDPKADRSAYITDINVITQ